MALRNLSLLLLYEGFSPAVHLRTTSVGSEWVPSGRRGSLFAGLLGGASVPRRPAGGPARAWQTTIAGVLFDKNRARDASYFCWATPTGM